MWGDFTPEVAWSLPRSSPGTTVDQHHPHLLDSFVLFKMAPLSVRVPFRPNFRLTSAKLDLLPPEVYHMILECLELEYVLALLAVRNKFLIDGIRGHAVWGKFFDCIVEPVEARGLTAGFTALPPCFPHQIPVPPESPGDYSDRSYWENRSRQPLEQALTFASELPYVNDTGITTAPYDRWSIREKRWNREVLCPTTDCCQS